MFFSKWLAFINKAHDFLAKIKRNSSEAYRSKNIMAERSKSFQIFTSVLLSKIFQRFAFKKLSNIFQRFAFKNFPAICFQKFSSDLLSKFCMLFSFQKAFKSFPAISFQNFSSYLLSKFWMLRDGETLKANCFQNFIAFKILLTKIR